MGGNIFTQSVTISTNSNAVSVQLKDAMKGLVHAKNKSEPTKKKGRKGPVSTKLGGSGPTMAVALFKLHSDCKHASAAKQDIETLVAQEKDTVDTIKQVIKYIEENLQTYGSPNGSLKGANLNSMLKADAQRKALADLSMSKDKVDKRLQDLKLKLDSVQELLASAAQQREQHLHDQDLLERRVDEGKERRLQGIKHANKSGALSDYESDIICSDSDEEE